MAPPTGYSVLTYGQMITCEPRMSAYADALRRAVTPGCCVIDIGAGTGILSVLACKYGAGSVVAIEPDDSVTLLPQTAQANDCADRITVLQGLSSDYHPEARADVVVSDIRGCLPLFEAHIPAIVDARERLLAPGGTLIPSRDTLRIALADSSASYADYEQPWLSNKFDIDLSAAHRFAVNTWSKVRLKPADLLSAPQDLATLDYTTISSPDLETSADLVAERAGRAHGLLLWFDTELLDGIGFSNAPGEPEQVYGQTFLPLERAVDLAPGDSISAAISWKLIDGSYVTSWTSTVRRAGSDAPEVTFRQSSFLAKVMSPRELQMRASTYVPPATPAQAVDRYGLSLIDGDRSLQDMAAALQAEFPDSFPSDSSALNHITALAARYR